MQPRIDRNQLNFCFKQKNVVFVRKNRFQELDAMKKNEVCKLPVVPHKAVAEISKIGNL